MEKEGLVRSLAFLQTKDISIDTIVTDRHPQIQKYLRENYPSIEHYYDVWHVAKGIYRRSENIQNVASLWHIANLNWYLLTYLCCRIIVLNLQCAVETQPILLISYIINQSVVYKFVGNG
jgi:hypothetical protein